MKRFSLLVALCALGVAGVAVYFGAPFLRAQPKHVVVLMLDTTRADHLSAYGYGRQTTPTIDAFARENIRFAYAVTAAPWTPPSVASMFTGVYPATHGWMPPNLRGDAKKMAVKLDPQLETLAERFKAAGYTTIGVSPNPWITGEFGYNQGFDTFYVKERMLAEEVVRAGEKFISSALESNQPFFAYLHFLDPHDPYQPPGEFKDTFQGVPPGERVYGAAEAQMINLYDGELRYLDAQLERFFSFLKQRGIYDDISIILVADHGEQFRERGEQGHGYQLFNEELHVPLIVKSPKSAGAAVIEVTASTVDVFKTALAAADISAPQDGPGVSLFDQAALEARRGVLSEIDRHRSQRAYTTSDGVKVIVESAAAADATSDAGGDVEQFRGLFNWRTDYLETAASAGAADPELVATLRAELKEQRTRAAQGRVQGEAATGEIKDSTIEQLKTLGYLQ